VVSDLLAPMFGQESLRYALVLFSPGFLWPAYYYWKAANSIEGDIRRVDSKSEAGQMETKAATLEADTPKLNNESTCDLDTS